MQILTKSEFACELLPRNADARSREVMKVRCADFPFFLHNSAPFDCYTFRGEVEGFLQMMFYDGAKI